MRIKKINWFLAGLIEEGVVATTIYPFGIYVTQEVLDGMFHGDEEAQATIRHEATHWLQAREMLCIPFYIWYGIEYLFKYALIDHEQAYYQISFEREAYYNEDNKTYNKTRRPYAWFKYISKRWF
jgi:hypothetical protein